MRRGIILGMLLVLFALALCKGGASKKNKEQTHPIEEEREVVSVPSLFQSNCSYKSEIIEEECEHLQVTFTNNVEILLPVHSKTPNKTLFVPFYVRTLEKATTFSKAALEKLEVKSDHDTLLIIDRKVNPRIGQENILGQDFLQNCLLAIDFISFEAGIAIKTANGTFYTLNWPIDSFKDHSMQTEAARIIKKYHKLKKTVTKMKSTHTEKMQELNERAKQQESKLATLQQKIAEKTKANNSTETPSAKATPEIKPKFQ